MSSALHPEGLDPGLLLTRLEKVRQDLSDHPEHAPGLQHEDLDEIQQVLASSLDAPRARYRGARSDRPPPVVFIASHAKTSAFQSVVQDCVGPLEGPEEGRRHPLRHWADELKDIFRQFGPCDPRWVEVRLRQLLTHDVHSFVPPPADPVAMADTSEVVLVGDWATALPQALNVSRAIRGRLQTGPPMERHVVHLGDTYYSGLREEYDHRFLPHWPVDVGSPVSSWSLNGNHDMYTGGHGYFETLLKDARFGRQQGSSNFVLRNGYWQLVALDSAYQAPDDPSLSDEQQSWLARAVNGGSRPAPRQTVLLSHHQAFSAYGDSAVSGKLAADVTRALGGTRVAAWFWGHEHRGTVYAADITAPSYNRVAGYTATVGHGGVPQLVSLDGRPETTVDEALLSADQGGWQFDGRYTMDEDTWLLGGYAVLSFDHERLEVSHFDESGALRHGPTWVPPV
jgi:Calcineurin-like phosphoesterase